MNINTTFVLSRSSMEGGERVIGNNSVGGFKFVIVNDKSYFLVGSVGEHFLDKVF